MFATITPNQESDAHSLSEISNSYVSANITTVLSSQ